MFEKKQVADGLTREEVAYGVAKVLDMPIRAIRIVRVPGQETSPGCRMKVFIDGIAIERYDILFRDGEYTVFDSWQKMKMFEKRPLATRNTPTACIKFFSRVRDVSVRSIRLCRTGGFENDPEYEMKFFIGDIIIDRYEVRFRNGTYTIFDTWGRCY